MLLIVVQLQLSQKKKCTIFILKILITLPPIGFKMETFFVHYKCYYLQDLKKIKPIMMRLILIMAYTFVALGV